MRQSLFILAALVAGFVGGVLGARLTQTPGRPGSEHVIRASRFELLDENGRVISFWGIDKRRYAVLAFGSYWPNSPPAEHSPAGRAAPDLGDSNNQRAAIGVVADYPFLTMNGVDGKPRIRLNLSIYEKPLLTMGDESGTRLYLGVAHSDTPSADDNNWLLTFEPDRAWIGMGTGTKAGQKYVEGVFGVNRDKVLSPYGGPLK